MRITTHYEFCYYLYWLFKDTFPSREYSFMCFNYQWQGYYEHFLAKLIGFKIDQLEYQKKLKKNLQVMNTFVDFQFIRTNKRVWVQGRFICTWRKTTKQLPTSYKKEVCSQQQQVGLVPVLIGIRHMNLQYLFCSIPIHFIHSMILNNMFIINSSCWTRRELFSESSKST